MRNFAHPPRRQRACTALRKIEEAAGVDLLRLGLDQKEGDDALRAPVAAGDARGG